MTRQALTYLAAIALTSILGLVACGIIPGDQAQAEETLSTTLIASATAIAALTYPSGPRS